LDAGIEFVSELSLLFFQLFRNEAPLGDYFSKVKPNYNFSEGVSKRLLENVRLVSGLDQVMTDLLTKLYPTVKANKDVQSLFEIQRGFHEKAKLFLKKRKPKIFTQLLEDCNNTAVYLPRETANEVANKIQRPFNQLVYTGREKLFKKDTLIDLIGHIPPFVLDTVASLKVTGIIVHIFDFISSTSKPPPTERKIPFKPTMEGNTAVVFIILLGGLGVSALCFVGEKRKDLGRVLYNLLANIWLTVEKNYIFRVKK